MFDGDLPGGCSGETGSMCQFMLPGVAIPLPGLASGETHSCLMRVRTRQAYVAPAAFRFFTATDQQAPLGGWMVDPDNGNNGASLRIGPVPSGSAPTVMPTLDARSLALLALALVGIAWRVQRRAASSDVREG